MNQFRETFTNQHVILPVIHAVSYQQILRNAQIAYEAEVDGIFLINHSITHQELLEFYERLIRVFPKWWIGLNLLNISPQETFEIIPSKTSGIWVDNALIDENQTKQGDAQIILKTQQKNQWKGLYFGGIAFKYQRPIEDLTTAVQIAQNYMDIITTSGVATGKAAELQKIQTMKKALGDFPLAIASGITPNNIERYLPYSDCYLVATGISKDFENFDPSLLTQLVKKIRKYKIHFC